MKRFKLMALLAFILIIWFMLSTGISLYMDFLWFDSVGYLQVFNTVLRSKFYLWLAGFTASLALAVLNFRLASRHSFGSYWISEEVLALARRGTEGLFWIISLIVSVVMGVIAQSQWINVLQFRNAVPAGTADPLYGHDLSFYFFSLPVFSFILNFILALLVFSLITASAAYVLHGHVGYRRSLEITSAARVHLSLLSGLVFLLIGIRFWLQRYDLLFSRRGIIFGASYTDVQAQLYAYWILLLVSILVSLALFIGAFRRGFRATAFSLVLFVIAFLAVNNAYPALVQSLSVKPNELQKETPYIRHNVQFTSRAYKLDKIEVREFIPSGTLELQAIARNETTIRNIRLWDWRPLKDCYDQLQSIRPYYEFEDVDVDRYEIQGNYRQVMLSVRELDFSKISAQAQSWINQFFQYTHGYGLCLSPVNEVTDEGLPQFFIKDIPPQSNIDLRIERPEVYFGEKTLSPVFVRTSMEEFDYPIGDQNAVTTYKADRGIAINTFLRKLLFAWEMGSYEILLTENFTSESRVLMHRQIQERVSRIAPFLLYDQDPYIVIHDGKLVWIQDAYTVTDRYPYSEPFRNRFNYIRNSVKIVIDAYLGDVTFYIADEEDPLIQVYSRIFPQMFRPLEQMPEGLRKHVRYPVDFFNIQREIYRTYHMRDPRVFYNKEDLWDIPNEIYAGNEQPMDSYYVIMSLPGSKQEEFLLLTPFTPRNKNNMIAWLAALSDGPNYGRLVLFQFPKQELTYGPMQIEARIDQDPNISQLITLWSQKGSRVIRGNLLVIPVENSLLYIEPLYLQAEKSEIPELTRIILVYENRVIMSETLESALQTAFGSAPPPTAILAEATPPVEKGEMENLAQLARQAQQHFEKSQEYLRQGDWSAYGEEQTRLGEVIKRLAQLQSNQPATP
ncbi:MAG: UPF0182 family protein [Acidobacteria bacterium]|nr:UPF0182 family protein [Acidobacteriota bacterium]